MKRKSAPIPSPSTLLKRALKRKMARNPSYSMRALARDLGISAPYLSRIMKGEKPFPEARFEAFVEAMDLDEPGIRMLKESLLREAVGKKRVAASAMEDLLSSEKVKKRRSPLIQYHEESHRFPALEHWYSLALLDLAACDDFDAEPAWIAKRLGISRTQAEASFRLLCDDGLIAQQDGKWTKTQKMIHIPTKRSHPLIRKHHQTMMHKAIEVMNSQTDDSEFDLRLITSLSCSANPAKLPEARRRLQKALFEIVEFLAEGECTEVYQLNAQLFPLTLPSKRDKK